MAATLKDTFISLMTGFLKKANMPDSAVAYYSFTPVSGQPNYRFVFNDMNQTGNLFMQTVTGVTVTNQGSGYQISETPSVTFTAYDGGSGAIATASITTGITLATGLIRYFPLDVTGTNLYPYSNFTSGGTGWLDSSSNAVAQSVSNVYIFESGLLHFISTVSTPTVFAYRFSPSGVSPISGPGWVLGSIDVSGVTTGSSRFTWGIRDSGNNSASFAVYSGGAITTGFQTIYFGKYLRAGETCVPALNVLNVSATTPSFNLTFDNFKVWTGRLDRELIFNNKLIENLSGPVYENITTTSDTNSGNFFVSNGVNSMGLKYLYSTGVSPQARAQVNIALADSWKYFSFGFWHYYAPVSGFSPSRLVMADFSNGAFEIQNNRYVFNVTSLSATVATNVAATSGWHFVVLGFTPSSTNGYINAYISVDGQVYSSNLKGSLPTYYKPTWHFYGSDNGNSYNVAVDELSIWNRGLSNFEIAQLYNGGTGNFYPYTGISVGNYGRVSAVTVTNGGTNFVATPTVSIAAPTGGGTAAQAVALLAPDSGKIYASSFPAFSVGGTNNIINTLTTGTGTFAYGTDDFLRIGNNVNFNWTIFLAFNQTGIITGKHSVLLATKDSYFDRSGFIVGINDSNRLFFEHWDISSTGTTGLIRRSYTHNYELSNFNLISIAKDSGNQTITISNHDIAKDVTYSLSYSLQGYLDNNKIYFGGFPNSGNQANYTGFIGRMMDVLLLSGIATPTQSAAIAPAFFVTGYIPQANVVVYGYYPVTTGVQLTTVLQGTGVTGYSMQQIVISGADGSLITGYDLLPLTGQISGTGIAYYTGDVSGITSVFSGQTEQFFFYGPYIKNFACSNLVLLNYYVTTGDLLQVYSFGDKWLDQISLLPTSFNLYDYYIDVNVSSGVNVYSDGLLQYSGVDYTVSSGLIISTDLGQFQSNYSYLLYDIIPGTTLASGWTGWSGGKTLTFPASYLASGEVYLNGQKLISGIDYTQTATQLILTGTVFGQPVLWASGTFVFPPTRTGNRTIFTGIGLGYWNDFSGALGNLMDEMVWLNGQRLAPEIDYITVGSRSLLNSDSRASGYSFAVYTGDAYFSTTLLKTKPNIT